MCDSAPTPRTQAPSWSPALLGLTGNIEKVAIYVFNDRMLPSRPNVDVEIFWQVSVIDKNVLAWMFKTYFYVPDKTMISDL